MLGVMVNPSKPLNIGFVLHMSAEKLLGLPTPRKLREAQDTLDGP